MKVALLKDESTRHKGSFLPLGLGGRRISLIPLLILFLSGLVLTACPNIPWAGFSRSIFTGPEAGDISANGDGNWTAINNGLNGYSVTSLAIDPAQSTTLYAGTWGGGLYKSTNGGESWTSANIGLPDTYPDTWVNALIIDPTNSTTLYAGFDDGGVFKSTNGGGSWSAMNTGIPSRAVRTIAIDPGNSNTLYAGIVCYQQADGCIFKSTNGGGSWTSISTGIISECTSVMALAVDFANPTSLYAATAAGLYKSTNGGESWFALDNGLTDSWIDHSYFNTLIIDPTNSVILYAGNEYGGAFKSINGGDSWTKINAGLWTSEEGFVDVDCLAIDPMRSSTVYAGLKWNGVYKSTDGGMTWSAMNAGLTDTQVRALAIDTTGATLYAGTIAGGAFCYELSTEKKKTFSPILQLLLLH